MRAIFFRVLVGAVGALALGLASPAQADVLVSYTFANAANRAAPTTVDANVAASDIDGWLAMDGSDSGLSSSNDGNIYAWSQGAPTAFDAGIYLEFTVTANTGSVLNLGQLAFDLGSSLSTGSPLASYTASLNVRTDVDGYAADLILEPGTTPTASVTTSSGTIYVPFTADLSGAAYQNLSAVTFRMYPTDSSDVNQGGLVRADNFTLTGSATLVPEPATMGLLAVGAICLVRRRNRSQQS